MRRLLLPVLAGAIALGLPSTAAAAPPEASFTFTPTIPEANTVVTFTSTSTDPDGDIERLRWDLNGNGFFERAGRPEQSGTIRARFVRPGTYTVTLHVQDAEGETDSVDQTISVVPVGSVAKPPPSSSPAPPPSLPAGPASVPVAVAPVGAVAGTSVRSPARLLAPFPVVRIQGRVVRRGAAIRRLTVHVPRGSRVRVLCDGRGCPKREVLVKVARKTQILRFQGLERRLGVGTVVRVFVSRPGRVGKYTRFVIRRNAAPNRRDMCLATSGRPRACPTP